MKKIISISLAVLMLVSCFVVAANAEETFDYSIRVEGINGNLYTGSCSMSTSSEFPIEMTVADALKDLSASPESNINVVGLDEGFVTEINGEKNGHFGGYDGWQYAVNNESPATLGMADYKLKNNDSIVIYYGDFPCQVPVLDDSESSNGVLKVKSYDTDWSTGDPVSVWAPVEGATLKVDDDVYTTDKDGVVNLTKAYSGQYDVQIEKKSDKGCPQVCRFSPENYINLDFKPEVAPVTLNYSLRIESVNDTLYYSDCAETSQSGDPIDISIADALKTADASSTKITIKGLEDGDVAEINGVKDFQYGLDSRWQYIVNGAFVQESIMAKDYKIKDGDEVVIYYGDYSSQIPVLDDSELSKGILKVKSYDLDWNSEPPKNAWFPVAGATLTVDGDEYKTDSNGAVKLKGEYSGKCQIQIEKKSADGAPVVCRFPYDYTISLNYKPAAESGTKTTPKKDTTSKITITKTPVKTTSKKVYKKSKKPKKNNTLKIKVSKKTLKAKKLKKKSFTFKLIKILKAKGKITYVKVKSGSSKAFFKKFKIAKKTGKITIKKGKYKKGTFTVKIKVTAKGDSKFKSKSKTVTLKIKVK